MLHAHIQLTLLTDSSESFDSHRLGVELIAAQFVVGSSPPQKKRLRFDYKLDIDKEIGNQTIQELTFHSMDNRELLC